MAEKENEVEGQELNTEVEELKKEEEQSDELGNDGEEEENSQGSRPEQDKNSGVDPNEGLPSQSIR